MCIDTRYSCDMTKTMSHISEILDIAGLVEVAYRRTDIECGLGEMWDITLPDAETTIRVYDNDGRIELIAFTGGRAQLIDGEATFSGAMAAPTFVAAAIDEMIGYYS